MERGHSVFAFEASRADTRNYVTYTDLKIKDGFVASDNSGYSYVTLNKEERMYDEQLKNDHAYRHIVIQLMTKTLYVSMIGVAISLISIMF